jgi:cell division protein FtsZ
MLRRCQARQYARIRVVGVGSGGISAANHMLRGGIRGVSFVTLDLAQGGRRRSLAPVHLELSRPYLSGKERERAREALGGADLIFIVSGLGGCTGTTVAPEVALLAREVGALVVAIVTHPFSFEGQRRSALAAEGAERLNEAAHTVIVIRNDRLLESNSGELPFHETYRLAHDVWFKSVQGINELVNRAGLVNVDFADVRAVVEVGGASLITTGRAQGPKRAYLAAEQALYSPLLESSIDGARGVLFNVTGGENLTLAEVNTVAAHIHARVHPEANIIFGATVDATLEDELHLILIASGGERERTPLAMPKSLATAGAWPVFGVSRIPAQPEARYGE